MRLIYHPAAEAELLEAARYYEHRVPTLGAQFLEATDRAIGSIVDAPDRCSIVEVDVRRYLMRRFPFAIYDRSLPEHILNNAPPIQKLLFVCSRNKRRSLTAEKLFEGIPGYQVRSVGTQLDARIVITEGHIGWADLVFVMEKSHLNRIRRKFPEALQGKRVIALHIPDDYEFMQPELLDELRCKLGSYVTVPDEFREGNQKGSHKGTKTLREAR
jgi:predicted protein tyrosine phosphatase